MMEMIAVDTLKDHHQPTIFEYAINQGFEIMTIRSNNNGHDDIEKSLPAGLRLSEKQKQRMKDFEIEAAMHYEARANDPSYKQLAAAVVINALKDAKGSDPDLKREAAHWLHSDAAKLFFIALDLSDDCLETWQSNGRPTNKAQAERAYLNNDKQ